MSDHSVLIVEDEALMALFLRRALEREGWSIDHVASTGSDAVRSAETRRPGLVLMDIRLAGDMDGLEAAAQIRAMYEEVPIVFMSGYSSRDMRERAAVIRPCGFLEKPFHVAELLACVREAIAGGVP